jgi:hypothetical protein
MPHRCGASEVEDMKGNLSHDSNCFSEEWLCYWSCWQTDRRHLANAFQRETNMSFFLYSWRCTSQQATSWKQQHTVPVNGTHTAFATDYWALQVQLSSPWTEQGTEHRHPANTILSPSSCFSNNLMVADLVGLTPNALISVVILSLDLSNQL